MKVNCSLSDAQVENLYTAVYKEMANALEKGNAFDPKSFMINLFEKIQEKKGDNVASSFLQVVPTLMKTAVDQTELATLNFDLNANQALVNTFRNTENGLLETLKYFKPTATVKDLMTSMEIEKGIINDPLSVTNYELEEIINDPFRWQADYAFTSTMQELDPRKPEEKDKEGAEKPDVNKLWIYKTIRNIKQIGKKESALSEMTYDGRVITLKTELVGSLGAAGLLDKTSADHLLRSNSMIKAGTQDSSVTPARDIVALVIADEYGNILFFDEDGNISTKEKGGKPVYQFLRDVRKDEKTGKLRVTDIYGKEDRILSPEDLVQRYADRMKISLESFKASLIAQGTTYEAFLESVDKQQQDEFKELEKLRDEVRAGNKKLLKIDGVSAGIVDLFFTNETVTLDMLVKEYNIPENDMNIQILADKDSMAAIYIDDTYYKIDRSNIPEEYVRQIAAVLVNPNLTAKQKNDFYLQFSSNAITKERRKLFINYSEATNTIKGRYRTNPNVNKNTIEFELTDPNAEQIIIDSLLKETILEDGNKTFATNLNINEAILKGDKPFYIYDIANKKFIPKVYSNFLLGLNLKVLKGISEGKADKVSGTNPYFKFQVPTTFLEEVKAAKEAVKSDTRSNVRKAKDELVEKLKTKNLAGEIIDNGPGNTFVMLVDGKPVEGRFEKGVSIKDVPTDNLVSFTVNDVKVGNKVYTDVVSIYNSKNKKIGQVSETSFKAEEEPRKPITKEEEAKEADELYVAPIDIDLNKLTLNRLSNLPNDVTQEQIDAAQEWWNNSPLSKLIKLEHMANIVNSDVFARFIIAGKRLEDTSIQLDTATGSSAVDLYHEAWHAFSQLYLTKDQKTKLYAETRKRLNNYDLSPVEVEEILAEEFRDYAKDPTPKSDAPTRNNLFRKIWNFIKTLFGKRNTKDELFEKLFFAGKNPKLLNKFTPLVDNHMFNTLNRARGIMNTETKDLALNYQDSLKVSNQLDSALSVYIDKVYDIRETSRKNNVLDQAGNLVRVNKAGTIQILADNNNRAQAYEWVKGQFFEKYTAFKAELDNTPEEDFNKRAVLNDKIRILNQTIRNWNNAIVFHKEHSTFDLIKQKYIEISEEEEELDNDVSAPENTEESERFSDKKVGEKSLLQLAENETLYILKSLFKVVDNKQVTGSLGFPELADFSKTWNIVTKVIGGEKDPVKMYEKLAAAIDLYPELVQLIASKIPDPRTIDTIEEFNIKAAFWQDFKKTKVRYVQLTVDKDKETGDYKSEVTDASIEFKNVINKFKSEFNSSGESTYISKTADNKSVLKIAKVVADFPNVTSTQDQVAFANAIGIELQDLKAIKDELGKNQKKYGIPYLHAITKSIYELSKNPNATKAQKEFVQKFLANPVDALYSKIPEGIYKKVESEKAVMQNLARLQSKFGTNYASFSVLNAEKNLVNEFIEDNTVSIIVNAINTVDNGRDLWTKDNYKYMRYLNPLINGFTEQSQLLKSIFYVDENTWDRKKDGMLDFVMVSGTQMVGTNEGANTTSLDVHSKYIQELNMMLKSGFQEFMRHASKSSSFGMKSSKISNLYINIDKFIPGGDADQYAVDNILLGYIQAELIRIQKIRANKDEYKKYVGYNREILAEDGKTVLGMAGEFFTAFDNILTEKTKNEIIEKVKDGNLLNYLESDPKLKADITEQVTKYFNDQTYVNQKDFQKSKWIDPALTNKLKVYGLSRAEEETLLIKAHTMNAWIHNFETASLIYGDIVQYNHAKQELHKRNPGSTSGGRGFMTDLSTQNFINSSKIKGTSYGAKLAKTTGFGNDYNTFNYNGEYNTAIAQDVIRKSIYIDTIEKALREDYSKRNLTQAEIDYRLKKELKAYTKMEEGDGQGFITIDAYRTLRLVEKNWSADQENLFQDIINGKEVKTEDITHFFPVYKLQNFGHLANTTLPVNAMHKFALMPLIPSVIKGSDLESLHHQMMKGNIQYFTFQTGSKVGSVTSQLDKDGKPVADVIYNEGVDQKSLKTDIQFTPNTVYLEYVKNVTAVPDKYKGKTVFATQLRKLILEGLYENGKIVNDEYAPYIKAYEEAVNNYTSILEKELLEEIGYEKVNGKYVSGDISKFIEVVQRDLDRKEIPEHLINYIQLGSNNVLTKDLSLHMLSGDIEKMITSLVEKRIVKQKVKGEALVQVASSMSNGLWDSGFKFEKAQTKDIEKYLGTNNLPFYYPGENGNTSAMKVAIALQGDFKNLLKLNHNDKQPIGTRERLNEMIKNDEWLNKGNNRKAITMTAVRIPVQGLNSMEFMEVYEFLDPAAGNIIIPPSEIVAKSGADFDVDKLTTFMPNIDASGNYVESSMNTEALDNKLAEAKKKGDKAEITRLIKLQKAALENKLIDSIKGILELPNNYATLVRPNDTYLMKDTADILVGLLPEYSRYKTISPTNTLEVGYNLHKHDANMVGKDVLGIIALENALNPLFTSLGAALPKTYKGLIKNKKTKKYEEDPSVDYEMRLLLNHNKMDDGRISLSHINTADGKDKIADLLSHLMNGSVDVEKDAWIFFIQANKEVVPTLLNLLKAGVPTEEAIYFVSQPLVKEYARQQRLYDSTYAELTGKSTGTNESAKYNALQATLANTDISVAVDKANKVRIAKGLKEIIADPTDDFYHPLSNANYKDVALAATEDIKQFDLEDLKKLVESNDMTSPTAIAAFLHYFEFEKQIKGIADLKRQSNPDTTTSKTIQEILQKRLGLDALSESSKVESKLVDKLRKESILGSFFDNMLTPDLVEPIFPLTDDKRVTEYLLNYLKNNNVPVKFGEGADGVTNFIASFKNAMVNFIYQNKLNQIISKGESFPGIPESMTSLDHQAFVTDFMSMLSENTHLKDLYSILEQVTDVPVNIFDPATKKIKGQQSVLTLNNKAVVKGALASSYHQNLIDLADDNVIKVKDPVKNKEISDMFKMLPLMSILQNGVGNTKYGLSYILPDTTYFEILEPASRKFIQNGMKNTTFDMITSMMIANDPNVNNYIAGPIANAPTQQQTPVTEPTDVPDGQTSEVVVEKVEDRIISINQYTFTIKPDGKMFFANGDELTDKTIMNKVNIRKELQDGTLRMSNFNNSNYYILSDNTILGSGTTNLAKDTIADAETKKIILDRATTYKPKCN